MGDHLLPKLPSKLINEPPLTQPMSRPCHIRDEDLLEAARAVLRERGTHATTAEVAARAGVSEGTLFNRFRTKDELFLTAMHSMPQPAWIARLPERVGVGEVRVQLIEIAHECVAFFREIVPMAMMSWSKHPDAAARPVIAQSAEFEDGWQRGIRLLSGYLDAEMRGGRIAHHDAEIVARVFTGALWSYVTQELMLGERGGRTMPLPEGMFVRGVVQLMMDGLAR